ncbi:hypothetical protein N7457_005667 [Penicillium paradoxum]|uniref:uncharacterized protein n=1 Tax=Penicillium paradoxum TaxID=176176 RepID=UPI0025483480|nr:uncharacterized protein N7457_005667 [Penicillium paradoxum]KAJ5780507.1 hypothetical protein N7457_005667 [Penicillium paradoxum]
MAWPARNNTRGIPEVAAAWSYADLENLRTEYLKQPENISMTPSPDPLNAARTLTAQPHPYNYQFPLPSTPVALSTMLSPTPSSSYLDPSTAKRSINPQSPRSVPHQPIAAIHSPASLYDPGYPSPWTEMAVSPPVAKEMPQPEKLPCRSRGRASKKKRNDNYGTFKCEWKGCTYDRLFSRKGVLRRHIETQHLNPGAFKCPWCDHASSRRENLKAHRQAIHKESL